MLRLVILLLFLAASVWFGLEIAHHPGYLFVVYQPWMVQMPIWFAFLSLLLIFVLFYILITSVDRFHFWCFRIKNWFRFRKQNQSYSKTQRGLSALIEARWKKSEKLLLAGINQTVDPLVNYLGAAKAAHELQAYDRRDDYIQKAYHVAPEADLAIGLTQAELELSQDQLEQAAATLDHLRQLSPRHPRVLQLLEKVYVRLSDWQHLLKLLPNMRKAKVLTNAQADIFEKNIYCEILNAAKNKSLQEIEQIWYNIPKHIKKNPEVVAAYARRVLARQPDEKTTKALEDLIRKTLKYQYNADLVQIYGTLPFNNLNRQLVIAGAWLKLYGPKPALLFLLGDLCMRIQLWGKAKDYFEKGLAIEPNPSASLKYGKLLEQLGETTEAMQVYRRALSDAALLPVIVKAV